MILTQPSFGATLASEAGLADGVAVARALESKSHFANNTRVLQRGGAWRAAAAAAGVLVLCVLALVPWLGGFVALVALIAGIGALLLQLRATAAAAG